MQFTFHSPEVRQKWRRSSFIFGTIIILLFFIIFYLAVQTEGGGEKGKRIVAVIFGIIYVLFVLYHLVQASDKVSAPVKFLVHMLPLLLLLGTMSGVFVYAWIASLIASGPTDDSRIGIDMLMIFIICVIATYQVVVSFFFSLGVQQGFLRIRKGFRSVQVPFDKFHALFLIDRHFVFLSGNAQDTRKLERLLKERERPDGMLFYLYPERLVRVFTASGFTKQEGEGYVRFTR